MTPEHIVRETLEAAAKVCEDYARFDGSYNPLAESRARTVAVCVTIIRRLKLIPAAILKEME